MGLRTSSSSNNTEELISDPPWQDVSRLAGA
jgi:hypothetical protein